MSQQTIAVIMGGPSREYDISLLSGQAVLDNLDSTHYKAIKILINKNEKWFFDNEKVGLNLKPALERLKEADAIAFLALHGTYGEDGVLQALFERKSIPYTGSGVEASDLAMDKLAANERYATHDLLVPQTVHFDATDTNIPNSILSDLNLPVVVKPVSEGSSVGTSIVKTADQLEQAVAEALDCGGKIMVQEYIKGREVSCGVLRQGDSLTALMPTEIIPVVDDFYSYKAKYTEGGSDHITPAKMTDPIIDEIQKNAVVAHHALGCKTYSRTDMIVKDGKAYMIETNTLPGLTPFSLLPEQAKAAGISFPQLLDLIIAGAGV
jgi:D-alanine-D-alanine ligase